MSLAPAVSFVCRRFTSQRRSLSCESVLPVKSMRDRALSLAERSGVNHPPCFLVRRELLSSALKCIFLFAESQFVVHRSALLSPSHLAALTVRQLAYGHRSALRRPSHRTSFTVRQLAYGEGSVEPYPLCSAPLANVPHCCRVSSRLRLGDVTCCIGLRAVQIGQEVGRWRNEGANIHIIYIRMRA